MKKTFCFLAMTIMGVMGMNAQIITSDPAIITQTSTNIVLTYHPDDASSNGALANLPSTTDIYAHIGLITDKSVGASDWKYATEWLDNSDKYKLTYVSANTYTLKIGDFKSYFGIKDGEVIKRITLVFRTEKADKEGKTINGGDIFVDVYEEGFNISFTSSITEGVAKKGDVVNLKVATNDKANITLSVNGQQLKSVSAATSLSHSYTLANIDSYKFVATATSTSGETITEEINIVVPEDSKAANYPGGTPKMGAVKNADGTVTFCLAAPEKRSVILVPSWDNYEIMNKNLMSYHDYEDNRYFWITISGLDDTTAYSYYYMVDGSKKVADPYARLVLDCYSDKFLDKDVWADCPQYPYDKFDGVMLAVYQGNLDGSYKFSDFTIPAHDNLIIYEMLFRDFTGTEGSSKGDGTVRQAIEKIPYLVAMGVNAVELMPIMEFNGNNSWGYNTNFYFAPDKAYGSPKDYKDFVEICHQNGIAVILDIVFNQSDGLHPWYQMYPIESNPFYNKTAPHAYSVLNDWKQDNKLVQQQWTDVLKYWMTEYNVDGFRFDLVKGLGDNSSYGGDTEKYNQSRIDRMKRLHGVIKSVKPNGIHINEHLAGASEETEMAKDGQLLWGNFNWNSAQFAMGYAESSDGGKLNQMYDAYGRPAGSIVAYAESHDEERVAYKVVAYGENVVKSTVTTCKRLGALAAQLLLTPGPKMIWQFGELGANQTTKNGSDNNTDPKRVIWSNLDNDNYKGLYQVYCALASLRTDNPDLFGSGVTYSTSGMGGSMSTPRTLAIRNGNKEVIAFINSNISGSAVTVSAQASKLSAANSQLICASLGTTPTLNGSGEVSVSLAPNCMAVFATTDVAGVEDIVGDSISSAFEVYGGHGEIVIIGEYKEAKVYTAAGQAVAGLQNLVKGIYLVRVDGETFKVAVK